MADSLAQHTKRRISDISSDNSPERDSKRQRFPEGPKDDDAPECDHDAAFSEAMAFSEVEVEISKMSGAENVDEEISLLGNEPLGDSESLQHANKYCQSENSFTDNYIPDLEESSFGIVCFGTIPSMHARCARPHSSITKFPVSITSSERFHATENEKLCGIIPPQYGNMMQSLLTEETLKLYAFCSMDTDTSQKYQSTSHSQISCCLDVTIYGPKELFGEIGEWFQDYNVYLQDPRTCDMDVKYWNPHRLSSTELKTCPYVSQVILFGSDMVRFQEIEEQPDPLDIISGQDDLEETAAPKVIRAALHRHQKQALTFMLRREKGWELETKGADVWEALDSSNDRKFCNRISNTYQNHAPPEFYGGIIADPMGLGKTLTMIALAATDIESVSSSITEEDFLNETEVPRPSVSATLVIVPQQLISTWEDQIKEHTVNGGLRVRRHHGKERLNDVKDIEEANIILTTYHTVSADWQKTKSLGSRILFSIRWKRIILDEAHLIRNMKTRMARAICDLESASRWAVTGTPIQNHLNDMAALLKFVRAYPYNDPKKFDTDISHLWKSGEDEEAVKRLTRLSRCLILRRAKRTITLPLRHDLRCPVEFSRAERALYVNIRDQTITKIDDALAQGTELPRPGLYVNFLQQIESMRLVCNLGLHYTTRHDRMKPRDKKGWAHDAQKAFNLQREMETIGCSQCSLSLEVSESLGDGSTPQDSAQFFECLRFACADCSHKNRAYKLKTSCGHIPVCPIAPVSVSNTSFEEVFCDVSEGSDVARSTCDFPSKVKALISDLKKQPNSVKCIVFSTWRLTLDLVEAALKLAQIRSVRFDGKVPQSQRKQVLDDFRSDPDVRIILLTLQCGAVGLTLTEASRAYLMEPHWNPTIEEQALARIDRIGQLREVTTVRFYIRDSFEERVIETQKSKKNLASVLLSGHDGGQADNSLAALQASNKVVLVKQKAY